MAAKKKNKGEPNLGGRPPAYDTPEKMQTAIQDYFDKGVKQRPVVVGKGDGQQVINIPVPTITGLCYYLGFESRQSFYDYEKKQGFTYTVKRARLFIEREYEEQLHQGNVAGPIFALKNMGWYDKQHFEHSGQLTLNQIYDEIADTEPRIPGD